ncbi:UDP-N-acetylmuramoyl-tripeptide--D-alanyl-D-alanine ligase [Denitrificimonas caeni]|uniref:UDP-N-acetylmuramoyl-tripeptide--D-alanyl-D- alanine ligase n=1 Tax=Denitrificimonas caeni TaxID=521720 RepID=UPI0019632CC3|nr:UDP-N-acetylmuramoyl-tripeptide--D-alanyl-D-alanine ligase [Denitrificimonas caeni]
MFKPLQLSQLLEPLKATLQGADLEFHALSTDSRKVSRGQLFVALRGEFFDGHLYLADVAKRGAVAAVVEEFQPEVNITQLCVADTRIALGQIALINRQQFNGQTVAVTGSSGKTTVKEMLASICRCELGETAVLATRGNLNNELGVPFTLLELNQQHRAAVVELGASHAGEIAYTAALVQPMVAVISNAGMAHAGEFGGPEHIVLAKGEILDGLGAENTAVLNLDDPAFAQWRARNSVCQVLSFSTNNSAADVYASGIVSNAQGRMGFNLHGVAGECFIQLAVLGLHNVSNALAAVAAAHALDLPLPAIKQGLENMNAISGRSVVYECANHVQLIDDSYNANPASIRAAIDVLQNMPGQRVLVLGDMGELGEWAEQEHAQIGTYAKGKVDAVFATGPLMQHAIAQYCGISGHFLEQSSLIEALLTQVSGPATLLIKGSRSAAMEHVVNALRTRLGDAL